MTFLIHTYARSAGPTRVGVLGAGFGAFSKLRKAAITWVMSPRPYVGPSHGKNSAPTGQIFMKFVTRGFCKNLSRIFKKE